MWRTVGVKVVKTRSRQHEAETVVQHIQRMQQPEDGSPGVELHNIAVLYRTKQQVCSQTMLHVL